VAGSWPCARDARRSARLICPAPIPKKKINTPRFRGRSLGSRWCWTWDGWRRGTQFQVVQLSIGRQPLLVSRTLEAMSSTTALSDGCTRSPPSHRQLGGQGGCSADRAGCRTAAAQKVPTIGDDRDRSMRSGPRRDVTSVRISVLTRAGGNGIEIAVPAMLAAKGRTGSQRARHLARR